MTGPQCEAVSEREFDTVQFAEMATPTVLLTCSESLPFLKDATERVNNALPNSWIGIFEGHAHEAMLTAPDRFIEEMFAFIRESDLRIVAHSSYLFQRQFKIVFLP